MMIQEKTFEEDCIYLGGKYSKELDEEGGMQLKCTIDKDFEIEINLPARMPEGSMVAVVKGKRIGVVFPKHTSFMLSDYFKV